LGSHSVQALECAIFARQITGMSLYGDAWRWWDQAVGRYQRDDRPQSGAVLVFKRSNHMRHGHVAVVRKGLGPRRILVDQANWQHGRISRQVSVIDASPGNDWSVVRVENGRGRNYGRDNAAYGFILAGDG